MPPFFDRRGQSIAVRRRAPLLSYADAARLTQIIGNLLHNASKFTPQGGQVTVELTREDDVAIVRVVDSATASLPIELPRVFDMFARIDRSNGHVNQRAGDRLGALATPRQDARRRTDRIERSSWPRKRVHPGAAGRA